MRTNKSSFVKFTGMLLLASCLLSACSNDPTSVEKQQLHLQPSATEGTVGDELSFDVTANGSAVDANIYIDSSRINGSTYTFNEAGKHTAIAKKQNYVNSRKIQIYVSPFGGFEFNSIYVSEGDVYIAGSVSAPAPPGRSIPVYWKNGSFHELDFGPATATSIYVSNSDVYIAGWSTYPFGAYGTFYLKNGTFQGLNPNGIAKTIKIFNNEVYVTGVDNIYNIDEPVVATYWKNKTPHKLADGAGTAANGIYFSKGDLYVAGAKKILEWSGIDFYWKNGTRHELSISGEANAMDVSDGNVYVAGYQMVDSTAVAAYWINGTLHKLSDGRANFINVTGGNVYIAGWMCDGSHCTVKYWENGALGRTYQISGSPALARSFIFNGDVYVVGTVGGKPFYWKNGTPLKLDHTN